MGSAGQHRSKIHFLQRGVPIRHGGSGNYLKTLNQFHNGPALVSFDEADDHIGAPAQAAVALFEHFVRFPDPRRGAEIDPKLSGPHGTSSKELSGPVGAAAVKVEVQLDNVHRRLAEEGEEFDRWCGRPRPHQARQCSSLAPSLHVRAAGARMRG